MTFHYFLTYKKITDKHISNVKQEEYYWLQSYAFKIQYTGQEMQFTGKVFIHQHAEDPQFCRQHTALHHTTLTYTHSENNFFSYTNIQFNMFFPFLC